jgi:hypothetical protein
MANNIIGTPVEITTATLKTAVHGGLSVIRYGGNLAQRALPGYIPPEILETQAILKQFEHSFGVAGDLLDKESPEDELTDRVSQTAKAMLDRGLVNEDTAVELRPVLPEDSLWDPVLNNRRKMVVGMLRDTLFNTYGVEAIYNTHPILPSEDSDEPVDEADIWGAIAFELDGLLHQIGYDHPQSRLAMLAITGPDFMERFFGEQIVSGSHGPVTDKFLVLEHVGAVPQENLLGRRALPRQT